MLNVHLLAKGSLVRKTLAGRTLTANVRAERRGKGVETTNLEAVFKKHGVRVRQE
jgi:hypothetical protein